MDGLTIINYQINKLTVEYPYLTNWIFIFIILFITVAFRKKQNTEFLSKEQTIQIKGLAIIFVVLGHFWTHVSTQQVSPNMAGCAVNLFLFLSGFGLRASLEKHPLNLSNFIKKRIGRVMIPYWLLTVMWIVLDFYCLQTSYSPLEIASTLAGINLTDKLERIDYVRWYITLLLIWYFLFYCSFKLFKGKKSSVILLIIGLILTLLWIMRIFPLGHFYQIFAFPLGVVFYEHKDAINNWFTIHYKSIMFPLIIAFLAGEIGLSVVRNMNNIFIKSLYFFMKGLSAYTVLGLILGMGSRRIPRRYVSKILIICGTAAYELFLLHGPILIKYNPIFPFFPPSQILISFTVFMVIITIVSYYLHTKYFKLFIN